MLFGGFFQTAHHKEIRIYAVQRVENGVSTHKKSLCA